MIVIDEYILDGIDLFHCFTSLAYLATNHRTSLPSTFYSQVNNKLFAGRSVKSFILQVTMSPITNTWKQFRNAEQVELSSRYLLTMTLPRLEANESNGPGTSWDEDFIRVSFNDIETWTDFTETNLNQAFGRVLGSALPWSGSIEDAFKRLDTPRPIESENDLDQMFLEGIAPILRHSLRCSRDLLCKALGEGFVSRIQIPQDKEAVKISLPQYNNDPKRLKRPNFPIYAPAGSVTGMPPTQNAIFVIGESARLAVFDPACFDNSGAYQRRGWIHVSKLAMYCKYSGTCLAFTITSKGVTVFRFFQIPNGDGTSRMGLQQIFAPWIPTCFPGNVPQGQDNQLSGAKAIWGLLMASLTLEGRRLATRSELRPISEWSRL